MKFKRFAGGVAALVLVAGFAGVPEVAQVTGVDTALTASAADTLTSGDYRYTIDDEGVTITKYSGSDTEVVIPSEIDGKPVRVIEGMAFYNCRSVTSITIPDTVTTIKCNAFYSCTSLTSINIPDGVKSIEGGAFSYCLKLESIDIPGSVTNLHMNAFSACSSLESVNIAPDNSSYTSVDGIVYNKDITEILIVPKGKKSAAIPKSVTSIGNNAFKESKIEDLTIPDSVTSIGDDAFHGSNIKSINIPGSVESIGKSAFENCRALKSVVISDGVKTIMHDAFNYCKALTSVTIPDSVTNIGKYAFQECTSLTSVTLPDSAATIGGYAFYGCEALTSVTIPKSISSIGYRAFGYYYYQGRYSDGERMTKNFKLYCYEGTAGEKYAKDSNLTYELIDDIEPANPNVTYTPGYGEVTLNWEPVYGAERYAVEVCQNNKWTVVGETDDTSYVLEDLKKGVNYKVAVLSIFGGKRHTDYSGMITVSPIEDKPEIYIVKSGKCGTSLTWEFDNKGTLTISGTGYMSYYDYDEFWSPWWGFKSDIKKLVIGDGVKNIGEKAFVNCDNLTDIELSDSVKTIDYYAFYGCKSLKNITIPKGITRFTGAFDECTNLERVDVDSNNSNFSSIDGVVYNKEADTLIFCPNARTSIPIPDSVKVIDDYAFCYCKNLKSIIIPAGVKKIGSEALGYVDDYNFYGYGSTSKINNFKIYCYEGTAGEKYAKDNGFEYELIKDDPEANHPKVAKVEWNEEFHQFRLKWNAVEGATQYGIAVKIAGKWKVQAYTDKTYFTSPKLRPGSIAEMVVCAKVNGKWSTSNLNGRAFKVEVK